MMEAQKTYTVSEVAEKLQNFITRKIHLEKFLIAGEISNFRKVNGHCYFNLKDENGQLACTMWRSEAANLLFDPVDGQQVLIRGSLSFYVKRGTLQLIIYEMQPDGLGNLYMQLEALKRRLDQEGYFRADHKKPKPEWIQSVGLVTGSSTAALEDVKKTIQSRWPMLEITLYPTLVQGEEAPAQVVKALRKADRGHHDAILLVRGGGSFEDLFCFNDERIVKAIYDLETYIVTGIGHEIDTTLADLVADHRAVTPTAAAQFVTLDQHQVREYLNTLMSTASTSLMRKLELEKQRLILIQSNPFLSQPLAFVQRKKQDLEKLLWQMERGQRLTFERMSQQFDLQVDRLNQAVNSYLDLRWKKLSQFQQSLFLASPRTLIQLKKQQIEHLTMNLKDDIQQKIKAEKQRFTAQTELLQAVSPQSVLDRGYALVYQDGAMISDAAQIETARPIRIQFKSSQAYAAVDKIDSDQKFGED